MKWKFSVETRNNVLVRYVRNFDTYVEAVDYALACADDPNNSYVKLVIVMKESEVSNES